MRIMHACRGWRDAALLVQQEACLALHELGESGFTQQVQGFTKVLRQPRYAADGVRPLGRLTLSSSTGTICYRAR